MFTRQERAAQEPDTLRISLDTKAQVKVENFSRGGESRGDEAVKALVRPPLSCNNNSGSLFGRYGNADWPRRGEQFLDQRLFGNNSDGTFSRGDDAHFVSRTSQYL